MSSHLEDAQACGAEVSQARRAGEAEGGLLSTDLQQSLETKEEALAVASIVYEPMDKTLKE